jgi:tetratricopeptide (TPR) repeat protein
MEDSTAENSDSKPSAESPAEAPAATRLDFPEGMISDAEEVSEGLVAASERRPGFHALLALDPKLKWAIGGFFVLVLVLVALLPHIWRVTPARLPVVRVSGLDYLEAKSLAKAARALTTAGDYKKAMANWHLALVNNPADAGTLRGVLETALLAPDPPLDFSSAVLQAGFSLLDLAETNAADLNLVVAALSHVQQDEYAALAGDPRAKGLDLRAYAGLAESNFRLGRMKRFDELWRARAKELEADPEAMLHLAAWRAGWGPASTSITGRSALNEALKSADVVRATTARRLMLRVASIDQNLEAYQQSFDWLVEHHADRVVEHVGLWELLVESGQRPEAERLARAFAAPAATAAELTGLARWLGDLGLADVAVQRIQNQMKQFGYSTDLWSTLASLLVRLERWNDLKDTAMNLRADASLQGKLDGYSLYLAGLADHHLLRSGNAEEEFRSAARGHFGDPFLAFVAARTLTEIGYPAIAEQLLRRVETEFGGRAEFWFALCAAAYRNHDSATLAESARKAYALAPKRMEIANNYAATMIAFHQNPQEVVQLTLRLHLDHPSDRAIAQNHAAALIQNDRLDEAESLLKQWDPDKLPAMEASTVLLSWAELWLKRGNAAKARENYSRIKSSFLIEPQKQWFTAEMAKLQRRG